MIGVLGQEGCHHVVPVHDVAQYNIIITANTGYM